MKTPFKTDALKLAAVVTICLVLTPAKGWSQGAPAGSAGANEVSRTTKAMNYRRAKGSVTVSFQGTDLMQGASGEAKVESKNNRMEIEAKFQGLQEATKFGLEYLTYVFWAVSPQGRAQNLGEVSIKDGAAELKALSEMQTFGLIVTAEPYFAVQQPGNMVVLENVLASAIGFGNVFNFNHR